MKIQAETPLERGRLTQRTNHSAAAATRLGHEGKPRLGSVAPVPGPGCVPTSLKKRAVLSRSETSTDRIGAQPPGCRNTRHACGTNYFQQVPPFSQSCDLFCARTAQPFASGIGKLLALAVIGPTWAIPRCTFRQLNVRVNTYEEHKKKIS